MLSSKELVWLSNQQKKLDKTIVDKHNVIVDDKNFRNRIVAFFVELGEYANETRAFKYWSNKPASDINTCLEEYIDGVHFIISLGNYINFDFSTFEFKPNDKVDEVDNYLDIVKNMQTFEQYKDKSNYAKFLNSFLNIMNINHYSEQQVLDMYKKKNAINYKRQDNNY